MSTLPRALIAESHRRQYAGEDYQAVAIAIADSAALDYESDEYRLLSSAPDENCRCAFCRTVDWRSD